MDNQEYFARIMRIGGKMLDSGLHFNYVMDTIYTGRQYNRVLDLLIQWDEEKEGKYLYYTI